MTDTNLNWDEIKKEAVRNVIDGHKFDAYEDEGNLTGERWCIRVYLGSILSILPSGKIWTFWTSNATQEERDKDTAWWEQAELEAEEHDFWFETGEGDGCDLYLVRDLEIGELP